MSKPETAFREFPTVSIIAPAPHTRISFIDNPIYVTLATHSIVTKSIPPPRTGRRPKTKIEQETNGSISYLSGLHFWVTSLTSNSVAWHDNRQNKMTLTIPLWAARTGFHSRRESLRSNMQTDERTVKKFTLGTSCEKRITVSTLWTMHQRTISETHSSLLRKVYTCCGAHLSC